MRNFLVLALFCPALAQAAQEFNFDCEPDLGGIEALCISEPVDGSVAGAESSDADAHAANSRETQPKMFGSFREPELNQKIQRKPVSDRAIKDTQTLMAAQEKIRQVELFLQPTKTIHGLGTVDSGPVKTSGQ